MGNGNKQKPMLIPKISWKYLCPYLLIFTVVPVFTLIIGKWFDEILILPPFPPFPMNLIFGFTVFFGGLAIGIKSTRLLYMIGGGLPWGELDSKSQSANLVTTGIYAYTRNPMTLGYSSLPIGMGIMFKSIGMAILIPAIVILIMVIWLKLREEPNMEKRFGEIYLAYKKRTPFLLPHPNLIISYLFSRLTRYRSLAN